MRAFFVGRPAARPTGTCKYLFYNEKQFFVVLRRYIEILPCAGQRYCSCHSFSLAGGANSIRGQQLLHRPFPRIIPRKFPWKKIPEQFSPNVCHPGQFTCGVNLPLRIPGHFHRPSISAISQLSVTAHGLLVMYARVIRR